MGLYVWGLEWLELEDDYGISDIYLKASRTYWKNNRKRNYYLEKSLQYLNRYIEKRDDSNDAHLGPETIYILVKQADINRQLKKYKETEKILNFIIQEQCSVRSYYRILAEHLYELVKKRDFFPAIQPMGNKLHIAIHENKKIDRAIESFITCESLNQRNIYGIEPLYLAIVEQNLHYVKLLTEPKYLKCYDFDESEIETYKALLERISNPEISSIINNTPILKPKR